MSTEKERPRFYHYGQHDWKIDKDDEARRRKFRTGYKKLDMAAMPEAGKVTLVCAFTDHGKSVFLRNMLLNMWAGYPDMQFMYYTFEDTNYEVWSHLARLNWHDKYESKKNTNEKIYMRAWDDMILSGGANAAEVDGMQNDMSKRIFVYDKNVSVQDVEQHINDELKNNPKVAVVFIDYLQDVEPETYSGQHHADLERMMIYMHNTAKTTGVAFIVAAQYRPDMRYHKCKKHDIVGLTKVFGSSSLYKKARLFYSIFNRTRYEYTFLHQNVQNEIDEIEIDILKQKKQNYADYLAFDLCKRSGRITESTRVIDRAYDLYEDKNDDYAKNK